MKTKTISFRAYINVEDQNELQITSIIEQLQNLKCVFENETILMDREKKCKNGSLWIHPPIFLNLKTPVFLQIKHINNEFQ